MCSDLFLQQSQPFAVKSSESSDFMILYVTRVLAETTAASTKNAIDNPVTLLIMC